MDPQVAAKNQPSTWGPINYQPQYNYIYIFIYLFIYCPNLFNARSMSVSLQIWWGGKETSRTDPVAFLSGPVETQGTTPPKPAQSPKFRSSTIG